MSKSSKLRKSAREQECMIRIPSVCNFNNETTVLAHLNGSGTGTKYGNSSEAGNLLGAFACSDCHDLVDHRRRSVYSNDAIHLMHLEGMVRTIKWWIDHGYLEDV